MSDVKKQSDVTQPASTIPTSGAKRVLSNGFNRDSDINKPAWSMFPPVIWYASATEKTMAISKKLMCYLYTGETSILEETLSLAIKQYGLLKLSNRFIDGAELYGAFNWALGAPLSVFFDSLGRHLHAINLADSENKDEESLKSLDDDHEGAFVWNLTCALHVVKMVEYNNFPSNYLDLPKYFDVKPYVEAKCAPYVVAVRQCTVS